MCVVVVILTPQFQVYSNQGRMEGGAHSGGREVAVCLFPVMQRGNNNNNTMRKENIEDIANNNKDKQRN